MSVADLMKIPEFEKFRSRRETFDLMDQIVDRNGLQSERWKELLDLTDAVYDGVISVKDMPELLAQAFGIEGRRLEKVARELIAVQIAPMRDVVPGLAEQITQWNALAPQTDGMPQSYEEYVEMLVARTNLPFSMHLVRRLARVIRQYLTGERNREDVVMFVQRPAVVGGLGMTQEQAATFLQFVDDDKGKVMLAEEVIGGVTAPRDETKTSILEIAPSHALSTETPIAAKPRGDGGGNIEREEEKSNAAEIAAHEKRVARVTPTADDGRFTAAVQIAIDAAAPTLAKMRVAKKKFGEIAGMAIKGIRDPYQTRGIIERDLGITGDAVLELIEAVMLGMETYNARIVGAGFIPPTHTEPYGLGAALPTSESDVLDKRFATVAGKMPTTSVEPVMPDARVSAARTKEEERAEQAAKIDPVKLEVAAASTRPEPAKAMLTVGSVPPPPPGDLQLVTDVQFKSHLVGPVEELGTMTPADFRRLSSSADEAGRKVLDLLHALESTAYEERIRGILAWRQSPVHALYAQMTVEALNNGIALAEIATRRRNKGDESLSPAELRTVANINAAIRF